MNDGGISIRIGPVVLTPEGLLLACALCVFLLASYGRVRQGVHIDRRLAAALLAWVSLCGVAGAAIYGIPGTLAALRQPEALPLTAGVAFGSFGGYWGVLIGGFIAARILRYAALPLLDALVPGILLGGFVARAAVLFTTPPPLSATPFVIWSVADMALHAALFVVVAIFERRPGPLRHGAPLAVFLCGYGAVRFILEFFRDDGVLWAGLTWGHHMSFLQTVFGCILLATALRYSGNDPERDSQRSRRQ